MKKEPEKIQSIVTSHIEYWRNCKLKKYLGGPFTDRSGGLIIFEIENIKIATKTVMNDPFILENLIERKWIKEWETE